MRAGGVTFLLSLALIHVSWAGNSKNEIEEVPAADGVEYKAGYVFNEDKIFTEKADSIIQCSAEAMKDSTTKESRHYYLCQTIDHSNYCILVSLDNVTNIPEEIREAGPLIHGMAIIDGYPFEKNKTLFNEVSSLFNHTYKVLNQSTSGNSSYFSYCKKVGDDIVCLTGVLMKYFGLINEEKLLNSREDPMFVKHGYIFDDDEIFAEKSGSLLNYTREVMRPCTTRDGRDYLICSRVKDEITCLDVWYVKGVNEFIDELYPSFYRKPNAVHPRDYAAFYRGEQEELLEGEDNNELLEVEDNNELMEGKDSNELLGGEGNNDKFKKPPKENIEE